MVTAIITAAGQGKRMGQNGNKLFLQLCGRPILEYTVLAIAASEDVERLIVTASGGQEEAVRSLLSGLGDKLKPPWQVVAGGQERQHSVANALRLVPDTADIILVHDGARPMVSPLLAGKVVAAARKHQAALAAVKVKDTIKENGLDNFVAKTLDRNKLWSVQTPQAFQAGILRQAYAQAERDGYLGTDDASLVERIGVEVKIVEGDYQNIKITTPEDIVLLEGFLKNTRNELPQSGATHIRVGIGYDVHQLTVGRKLILGGVEIDHTHGLKGHSDADVLLHAVKDALLGAAALGDIGMHFPDNDSKYEGVSSLKLLEKVRDILSSAQFRVNNIDATIVAQQPKLAPYIAKMTQNTADALKISAKNVNIKATTTEGLGFAGRQEGIAAYATASIVSSLK